MSRQPHDPIDKLLDLAEPSPELQDVTSEVWRRISLHENTEEPGTATLIQGWFTKWPFAALFVASCILTGLLLAEFRINRLEQEQQAQLARNYLVLIDPLLQEFEAGGPS